MLTHDITFRGQPVTLVGEPVKIGELAPDFAAHTRHGHLLRLSEEQAGRILVLASLPSLTLPECAGQVRVLNGEVNRFGGAKVPLWLVTSDAPSVLDDFAQEFAIDNILLLSDQGLGEFGTNYGVRVEEAGFLARSLFTIGRDGRILYREIHPEIIEDPEYYRAFKTGLSHLS